MKVLIAAGGTGGHLYPAIALAHELKKTGHEILFAIQDGGATAALLDKESWPHALIASAPLFGQSPGAVLKGIFLNGLGIGGALKLLRRFPADRVVGFGAYVAFPVMAAAFLTGKKIWLHEQNAVPGWSNRVCAFFADGVGISFPGTEKYFGGKALLTGNLVRSSLLNGDRNAALKKWGLDGGRTTILIFGGSAGAKSLNRALEECLAGWADLREAVQCLHLTGGSEATRRLKTKYGEAGVRAVVLDYCHEMGDAYAAADFAVCRSGAGTLTELAATATPAILVPYPHAVAAHQKKNAAVLETLGSAWVVEESDGWAAILSEKIRELARNKAALSRMRENCKKFPIDVTSAAARFARTVLGEAP